MRVWLLLRGRALAVLTAMLCAAASMYIASPSGATTATETYVNRLISDVLLREPTDEELFDISTTIDSGTSRGTVADGLIRGREFAGQWAVYVYQAYAGITPSQADFELAVTDGASGHLNEVEVRVLASATYYSLNGGTNPLFIVGLYQDLLGRNPSTVDRDYWSGRIDAGSTRSWVARNILRSSESSRRRVGGTSPASPCSTIEWDAGAGIGAGSYCLILDRQADSTGLTFWTGQLQSGVDLPELWRSMVGSTEYYTLSQL